jgi:hypothetical protein
MLTQKCKFIQINLQHSKAEKVCLCRKLATVEIVVALIQEHWVNEDEIKGLCHKWGKTVFSGGPSIAPRTCLFVRNTIQAFPLLELSSRDVTTVKLSFIGGGSIRELTVTSTHLSYDSDEPPRKGTTGGIHKLLQKQPAAHY